jgi:FkbH-like protein
MSSLTCRGVIISDFNAGNLAGSLKNSEDLPVVDTTVVPFGQTIPALLDRQAEWWKGNPDFTVVWTQPQSVIEGFGGVLRHQPVSLDRVLAQVDEYAGLLRNLADRTRLVLVPVWVVPTHHRNFGLLDLKAGGLADTLMRMNLRLSENLGQSAHIHLLNTHRWIESAGKRAFNPKLWYMGKIPFGNEIFLEAAKEIKAALRGVQGLTRKLVIVDLDDTLWGGIVGELGWENLTLGGHHYLGEAYVDFQRALKGLTHRGILLGIVSKNEEATALEAIQRHPEMVLRPDDFAGWRINWQDKAENILELTRILNLGLQSVVFIDDNPVERARVREALPEVLVPEWPDDKCLFESALHSLLCFNPPAITDEDRRRTEMYRSEQQREGLKEQVASVDEWLRSLGVKVTVERLNEANLPRAAQLLNKTNQMNLTTRRMTDAEFFKWALDPAHRVWVFRVSDKFGDSGITGIASLEVQNGTGTIVDFVLSCRVMGRSVEEAMVHSITKHASSIGLESVSARYIPTGKNKPCLDFWRRSGFKPDQPEEWFRWRLDKAYPRPDAVAIEGDLD